MFNHLVKATLDKIKKRQDEGVNQNFKRKNYYAYLKSASQANLKNTNRLMSTTQSSSKVMNMIRQNFIKSNKGQDSSFNSESQKSTSRNNSRNSNSKGSKKSNQTPTSARSNPARTITGLNRNNLNTQPGNSSHFNSQSHGHGHIPIHNHITSGNTKNRGIGIGITLSYSPPKKHSAKLAYQNSTAKRNYTNSSIGVNGLNKKSETSKSTTNIEKGIKNKFAAKENSKNGSQTTNSGGASHINNLFHQNLTAVSDALSHNTKSLSHRIKGENQKIVNSTITNNSGKSGGNIGLSRKQSAQTSSPNFKAIMQKKRMTTDSNSMRVNYTQNNVLSTTGSHDLTKESGSNSYTHNLPGRAFVDEHLG